MTDTDMAERFRAETTNHQMTVLHDDGLYRHLRFAAPGSSFYWFDIITWPGRLSVGGDVDTFAFARVDDMFAFFRGQRVNPQYWAEKIADGRDRAKTFDEAKFNRLVDDEVNETETTFPGLTASLREEMAEYATYFEAGAREFLRDFTYRTSAGQTAIDHAEYTWSATLHNPQATSAEKDAAWKAYRRTEDQHTFAFRDSWEWDLTDYDWSFLFACHAIVWGIAQYDEARKPVPA